MDTTLHGVVRIDRAVGILFTGKKVSPVRLIGTQGIQIVGRNVIVRTIVHTIETYALARLNLQHRGNDHLTVFRQIVIRIVIIIVVRRTGTLVMRASKIRAAVNEAHITATEDVAIALSQSLIRTNLTTMDIDLCSSEDIAVGIEAFGTTITEDVVALTATEDVTLHMTIVHFDMGLTCVIDSLDFTFLIIITALFRCTSADGSNLTTAENRVTNGAAPHDDITLIHTTVIIVATTEEVTTVRQTVRTHMVSPRFVVHLLFILVGFRVIDVADVAVVQRQVGLSYDRTALSASVCITLDGRHTGKEAIISRCCFVVIQYLFQRFFKILLRLILPDTNNHMRLTWDIGGICCGYGSDIALMITHTTFPSATIDVTRTATGNESIGTGCEVLCTENVINSARSTCSIEVFTHDATKKCDIGGAVNIATANKGIVFIT